MAGDVQLGGPGQSGRPGAEWAAGARVDGQVQHGRQAVACRPVHHVPTLEVRLPGRLKRS